MPQIVLVTGSGGSGRTTIAAATACAAAAQGHRTLLVSAEPAALLGTLLGPEPGVALRRVDAGGEFRAQAAALQRRGQTVLDLLGAAPLDDEELTELPGAEAVALLRALRHAADGADGVDGADGARETAGAERVPWDTVVVDLPPTPHGLNALLLPEQSRRYLRRLVPPERQAARALRPVLAQLAGAPVPGQWLYDTTARWERELADLQRIVESPRTAVRLVTEPGPLAAEALRTARAGLRLHGLALEAVVANRLLPTGSPDPWLAALAGQQQDALKDLRATCEAEDIPLCELPHLGRDPRGPEDLAGLAAAARATAGTAGPQEGARQGRVEDRLAADGHLVWRLPVPGARREELELVRRGDELIVGVGAYRRVLALPSALRRCRVSGAALDGGELRVRFTPDPQLWPRPIG
ncbi:ArsA family ATPase [Streptomyces boncukensis]|uniref:ArsA family ATPase n=1 Tax=Streptomyces boncukensis TaxID=2711219 RepID=A0A6G4WS65_9ACTN|nr:ArsA family ATPase [Streptomyces boncukensis]NGO68119.1 ArsA family ATPase [Streptomyces boncukensis]